MRIRFATTLLVLLGFALPAAAQDAESEAIEEVEDDSEDEVDLDAEAEVEELEIFHLRKKYLKKAREKR